jgi:coproporphyrinogen III oxidase-like Fe-S oxidoreductase
MGIHRYEISNFARPGFESLHNLKYWQLEPYAGFGADAHSFDGACAAKTSNRPAITSSESRAANSPHRRTPANAAKSASSSGCA